MAHGGQARPLVQDSEPFSQRFVMVMTIRDVQIVRTRDYTNPVTGARLLGKLPDLVAALSGPRAARGPGA